MTAYEVGPTSDSETVSVHEVARHLKIASVAIRRHLEDGKLSGIYTDDGWCIPARVISAIVDDGRIDWEGPRDGHYVGKTCDGGRYTVAPRESAYYYRVVEGTGLTMECGYWETVEQAMAHADSDARYRAIRQHT